MEQCLNFFELMDLSISPVLSLSNVRLCVAAVVISAAKVHLLIDLLFHLCIAYSAAAFPVTHHIHNNGWAHQMEKTFCINI